MNNLVQQLQSFVQQNKMLVGIALLVLVYFLCLKPKMEGFSGGQTFGKGAVVKKKLKKRPNY